MDTTTLVAALLHDTVEDTGYTLEALTADFGDEVGHLVDGVTKLDKVVLGSAAEAETIRKMIIAMARDGRVLVIKVADRLHNMRTMRFLPPEKQASKARETLEVIAPLAHRLGMATVKWELEDLSFAILHPKSYEEIVRLVADRAPSRDTYLAKVRAEINSTLNASKINAVVEGRPKHYWSIYQKMIVKGRDFDDIHDLVGVRILCERSATVMPLSAWCIRCGSRWPGGSRTTSRSRDSGCTSRCTPRSWARRASHWRYRSAPWTCTGLRSTGSRRTGGTRKPRAVTVYRTVTRPPRSTTWRGCVNCWTGSGRRPTPVSSWSRCATTWQCRRSSCSPRRAT